jgi:hypothetical protein
MVLQTVRSGQPSHLPLSSHELDFSAELEFSEGKKMWRLGGRDKEVYIGPREDGRRC